MSHFFMKLNLCSLQIKSFKLVYFLKIRSRKGSKADECHLFISLNFPEKPSQNLTNKFQSAKYND